MMVSDPEVAQFRLTAFNEQHGIYAAIYRDGNVSRVVRLREGTVIQPLPDEYAAQVKWNRPGKIKLKKSRAVLTGDGMVLLESSEPAMIFSARARTTRVPAPGRPPGSLHDGVAVADSIVTYGHEYPSKTPGSARVRVYSHPDKPTVVLISDHRSLPCDCPERWLAGVVFKSLRLSGFADAIWISYGYGLKPDRCGHVPAEFFDRLEFGCGMSRSAVSRQSVERLVGHYL